MSFFWYVNRMRSMGVREVLYRLWEAVKKRISRSQTTGWDKFSGEGSAPILASLCDAVKANASEKYSTNIGLYSQKIRSGSFSALGVTWPDRENQHDFSETDWRLDPITKNLWPGTNTFCFDIKYRFNNRMGDIKYVWELNRLQFLQCLACDVLLNNNLASLELVEKTIISWYKNNIPFNGCGWNSGIELALRSISLLIVSSLIGDRLSPVVIACLRSMLRAKLFWLLRFPSKYSSANNHLVAETAAIVLITSAMPEFDTGGHQNSVYTKVLESELLKQILADGSGAEQSPYYAAFTVECYLLCAVVLRHSKKPMSSFCDQRLVLFRDFVGWLASPDTAGPAIGDSDDSRVVAFGDDDANYVAAVAAAVGGYLSGLRRNNSDKIKMRDLIFGIDGYVHVKRSNLKTFEVGGLTIVAEKRCGRDLRIVFDHGSLGYLKTAAHGHADALSVIADLDQRPFLIDSGTYVYHTADLWRNWFRSTSAHNTLCINGENQSNITGPFNWNNHAISELIASCNGKNWSIDARHNGYFRKYNVIHRRKVRASPSGFEILDVLVGNPRAAQISFQLAADLNCTQIDNCRIEVSRGVDKIASIRLPTSGKTQLILGSEKGPGWCSPRFGVLTPCWRIEWSGRVDEIGVVTTVSLT